MAGLAAAISGNEDITLTTDIDCTGWTTASSYSGTIDGQNHAIKNLTTTFINVVGANSTIRDIVVKDADLVYSGTMSGLMRCGLFANTFTGGGFTVSGVRFVNCRFGSTATLDNDNTTHGFLAGEFGDTGTVSDCTLDSDCKMVFGNIRVHVGGLFGYIGINADTGDKAITVSRCANSAQVEVASAKTTEGLGGLAYKVVVTNPDKKTCSNKANLSFVDCTNDVSVTFTAENCGASGFVYNIGDGNMFGTVSFIRCVNNGDLRLTGNPQRYGWADLGGFVAQASMSNRIFFQDCINNGDVICEKFLDKGGYCDCVGGFVGRSMLADDGVLEFVGCANLGAVTGFAAGGFVGETVFKQVRTKYIFTSCYQGGTLTALGDGLTGGECIGYLPDASYKTFTVEVAGCLVQTGNFIGGRVAGCTLDGNSSITTTDNVIVSESEGLVSGVDLNALNAYQDCDLWKQGTQTPILKIMPDEPAPDVIEIKFMDTADYGSTVFKTVRVARGGWVYPPEESPVHEGVTFLGWGINGEVVTTFDNLTADTTFVAVYQSGTVELTVRFFDWDGTQIGEEQTVAYGEAAVAPADPSREDYVFTGWDKDFSVVKESIDVHATYIAKDITIETAEDFAAALAAAKYPDVTYHLSGDITIPSTFASIEDFIAGFDGEGHVIHMTSKFPLFKRLKGKVGNFILDGDNGGNPTTVTTGSVKYALVADDVLGGEIHDVVVRNFTMNTGDNCEFGLVAARLCDGGVIRRCLTESNCTFNVQKTQNVGAGAIVGVMTKTDAFAPMDEDGKPILGLELARVESCTNNAAICYYQARGQLYLGGIVGFAALGDATFGFTWTITNCVNNGNIVKTTANFNNARIVAGGILGYRGASGDNVLSIVDCVNTGDIMPLTSYDTSYIGGIIGMMGNTPRTIFRRNVNRGTIGVEKFPSGEDCTTGCFGGLVGYGDDIGKGYDFEFADSANYGNLVGGARRGGLFGAICPNSGGGCKQIFVNCANYGEGCQGEILGAMTTVMGIGIYRLNISNCFVCVAGPEVGSIVEQTNPQNVVTDFYGIVSSEDDGYTIGKAVRQLNGYAEANGYETWVKGRLDSGIYPELGIFCEKAASSGFLILFR